MFVDSRVWIELVTEILFQDASRIGERMRWVFIPLKYHSAHSIC